MVNPGDAVAWSRRCSGGVPWDGGPAVGEVGLGLADGVVGDGAVVAGASLLAV